MDTLPPKNLENLEKTLVNRKIRRKNSHKTKSVDLRLQEIQKSVYKKTIFISTMQATLRSLILKNILRSVPFITLFQNFI